MSLVLALFFALVTTSPCSAEAAQLSRPPRLGPSHGQEDEARARMERDMEKRRNQDRQKQLQRDTEKLLQLATELKNYVDKTNENILSLEVVKKAEEIEKYAHSVKEKMKVAN
jgi:hypothetical protein